MTPAIQTLQPVADPATVRTILATNDLSCLLLTLEARGETIRRKALRGEDQLVFVVEGEITIRVGEVHTMLARDQAHLVPGGEDFVIFASPAQSAKILQVTLPPRAIAAAQIVGFAR